VPHRRWTTMTFAAGARKAVSYYSVRVSALLLTRRPEVDLMLHHLQANHSHRHAGRGA
jgi:hypothetical protein